MLSIVVVNDRREHDDDDVVIQAAGRKCFSERESFSTTPLEDLMIAYCSCVSAVAVTGRHTSQNVILVNEYSRTRTT